MKKTILNSVCLGALALAIAHCGGGDDSSGSTDAGLGGGSSTGAGGGGLGGSSSTGNGGSSSTGTGGSSSTGAGGSSSTGAGGTSSTGAGGTATTGAGGATVTGAGGSTGTGGATGTGAGGTTNNGDCPAAEPMVGSACTIPAADAGAGANMCMYATDAGGMVDCSCAASNARNDAGMRIDQWACAIVRVRPDAGGGGPVVDAGLIDMCPANNVANNGNCAQFVTGLMCPGVANRECTCRAVGVGAAKTWNCVAGAADAATGG
jgi:hypothetical protein